MAFSYKLFLTELDNSLNMRKSLNMPTIISNLISVSEMLKVSEQRILITPNMGKSGEKCQKSVVKSTFNFGGTFGQSGLMTFRLSEETDRHKKKHFLYISMGLF